MLHILIVIAWIVAFGCWAYLASQTLKPRLFDRSQKKTARNKSSALRNFDRSVEIQPEPAGVPDRATSPKMNLASIGNTRRRTALLGYFVLFLWEAYWISEIVERFSKSSNPLQLPYFFLFVVMIGVPLGVYAYSRWLLRGRVSSS
jgi:hypothetical protein